MDKQIIYNPYTMYKKTTLAFLLMGGALAFSSCSKDDSEVYVGVDAVSEHRQMLKDRIDALPEIKNSLQDGDAADTRYENRDPETYTDKVTGDEARIAGYYGGVDLGLSVKWCSSNIGSPSQYNENVSFDAIYTYLKERRNLTTPVEKPAIEVKGGELPYIMDYDEYCQYMDLASIEAKVEKYERYCNDMQSTYDGAVSQYRTQQIEHHQYLYEKGSEVCWGTLSGWAYNANSEADSPEDIGGNKEYDLSAKCLGDGWRLPTRAEWQELIDKCTWEDHDGKYWLITGPSGKQIVLPSYSYKYNTAERANESTGQVKSLYDVYVFDTKTKTLKQVEAHYQKGLIRPVYTK